MLSDSGMPWASLGVDCDSTGAWLVWVDGSRAHIDQSRGMVQGALDLIQSRLAADRFAAAHPAGDQGQPYVAAPGDESPAGLPPDNATTVSSEAGSSGETSGARHGTEGGLGLATVAQFWSDASMGFGPRLDVSVGPPGSFALLLSEDALFGTGSGGSGVVLFDFQIGAAYGAPFKTRMGLGAVAMLGAERISASHDNSSNGLSSWALTGNLGARASLPWSSVNVWLGADLLLRSNDFQTGGPSPVSIPSTSFVLSLGCFVPAFAH